MLQNLVKGEICDCKLLKLKVSNILFNRVDQNINSDKNKIFFVLYLRIEIPFVRLSKINNLSELRITLLKTILLLTIHIFAIILLVQRIANKIELPKQRVRCHFPVQFRI